MTIISYSKNLKRNNIFEFNKFNSLNISKKGEIKKRITFLVLLVFLIASFVAVYIYIVNLQTSLIIRSRGNLRKIEKIKEKNNLLNANLAGELSLENFKRLAKKYNLKISLTPEYLKPSVVKK